MEWLHNRLLISISQSILVDIVELCWYQDRFSGSEANEWISSVDRLLSCRFTTIGFRGEAPYSIRFVSLTV